MMLTLGATTLLCVIGAALSVKDEDSKTLFHGEDLYILLPPQVTDVSFSNRTNPRSPITLMRGKKMVSTKQDKHRLHHNHLIIKEVDEGDEGVYVVKSPNSVKRVRLTVRDCTVEQMIKYGNVFRITLWEENPSITVEFRPSAVEANQTSSPAVVVLTAAGDPTANYQGRISVSERTLTLRSVAGADEGSYTVRDDKGAIKNKVCLNVREHRYFENLELGKKLKINLIINSSMAQLYYSPDSDPALHLLLDKGEFTNAPAELGFQDRLSLDGFIVYLDQFKGTDKGLFVVKDPQGFNVSTIHLQMKPHRLESLYVAIIALLGLLAFLLLVCLLSCLITVKKRAKRAAALEKLAQNAGKEEEGEAFRQVVKNITKLSEESKHSQADNTEKSQSTEVDIKGLEVSSKEVGVGNLETSDSGVGFNTALPLDTDTDAPDQIPDSEAISISIAPEPEPELKPEPVQPSSTESKPSAPATMEINLPETKVSPVFEVKKTPEPTKEAKVDISKTTELKPVPSPEPKAGLSPADPKPPPSPIPDPKATSPVPESSLAPTLGTPKAATPEPITNGTPEPCPESKLSPDHLDVIGDKSPKAVTPKTPEVQLKSTSVAPEASKDDTESKESAVAEKSAST